MKKLRPLTRCICSILIMALLLQLLPPGSLLRTASASSVPTNTEISGTDNIVNPSANTITPSEIPDTFTYQDSDESFFRTPLPEPTANETRYISILRSATQFSTLSESDAAFLCGYTQIPAESFNLLESNGVALSLSIVYAELAASFDLSLTTIISEAPTEEECHALLNQVTLYKQSLLPSLSGSTLDTTFKSQIFEGYTCEQVFNAYGVNQVHNINSEALLSGNNDLSSYGTLSEVEKAEINSFSTEFSISSNAIANHVVSNNVVTSEIIASSSLVKTAISEILVTNSFSGSEPGEPTFPETISEPFSYSYDENENFSLNTGALVYETVDYTLPGMNGLDLVIGRRYDSQKASAYLPSIGYESYPVYVYFVAVNILAYFETHGFGGGRWPYYDDSYLFGPFTYQEACAVSRLYNGKEEVYPNYTDEYADLILRYSTTIYEQPVGYETYLSTIKAPNSHFNDLYGLGYGWQFTFSSLQKYDDKEILHLSDGSSFELDWSSNSTSHLKGYSLNDKKIEKGISDFTSGTTVSHYRLTYQNGTREYFSSDGKLIGICDRYDNAIKFEHSSLNGYPYIKITDTLGRIITISGSALSSGHTMVVTLPDSTELVYQVSQGSSAESRSLSEYTDSVGRKTRYGYTVQKAFFDATRRYCSSQSHTYLNLTTITHPTNAQTIFTYGLEDRALGENGHMEVYKLISRADLVGTSTFNQFSFSYSANDCSGYPNYHDSDNLPTTFTYSATTTNPQGTTTTVEFNNKHLTTVVETKEGNQTLQKTLYEYNANKLPIKTTTRQYNSDGTYLETIEAAEYDNKGNVTAQWSTLANGDTTNTEYKTSYTYDSAYGLPLTQTYKTNEGTTVRVKNTLDTAKKNIISTSVYVNDTITRKTDYTYDTYGNVTQQKQYRDMGDLTDYALTEYTYQNGAYLTQEKYSGLVTVDGTAAVATPGQVAGIVVTTHTYDTLGRRLTTTDGNGNTTTYAYDALGNVTSVTNPDGTTVAYDRNYTANQVTVTDENSNSLIYTYTPLGQEYEIVDSLTNGVITRKEYDAYFRLSKVTDFVYGGVTEYTYDIFDRILSETSKQGDVVLAQTLYTYDDAAENGLYQEVTKTIVGDSNAPSIVTTQYTDKHGNVAKTGKILNGTEYFDVSTFDYVGNVLSTLTAADTANGLEYTSRFAYNEAYQVVTAYNALGQFTTNTYDALGNLVQATDYVGTPTAYTYDNLGRLLSQTFTIEEGVTASTKYEYDPAGNLIREYKPTNAVGETAAWAKTEYTYNNRGRLTAVIQYEGEEVASVTRYTYDGVGNTLTMTTGLDSLEDTEGSTTTYTYDRFGNVLTTTDALGKTETNSYSSLGRLNSSTDRNGSVTNYTYDALGRLLTTTVGEEAIQYTYTLTGQLRQEQQGQQLTQYTYDALGRTVQTVESPFSYTKTYTYDLADNRTSMTVVQGDNTVQAVTYTHDDLNRLSTVTENDVLHAIYTYDDNGNRASLTYGNGVVENYQYNLANWITSLVNCKGNETLSSYAYTYYASGSQKSETDHNDVVTSYTYDDLGRLIEESETGGQTITYTYDANGNRRSLTASGTPVVDEDPDPVPEPPSEPGPIPFGSITLDPTGGTLPTGVSSLVPLPVSEDYSLPIPTRMGYTFTGWYLGDTLITNENLSQITANCMLVAHWIEAEILTLDLNGGFFPFGEEKQIQLPVPEGYTLPEPAYLLHTFTGWYLGETLITDADLSEITESCTLVAHWEERETPGGIIVDPPIGGTYIIVYHANKGEFAESTEGQLCTVGQGTIIRENPFARMFYTFVGWGTTAYGECTVYQPGDVVTDLVSAGETVHLYARWQSNNTSTMSLRSGEPSTTYTTTYTYDANNRLIEEVSNKTGTNVLISYTYDDNGNLLSQLDVDNTAIVRHTYDGFNQLVTSVMGEGTITYTYNAQGIRTSRTVVLTTTHYLLDGGNVIGEVEGDAATTYLRGVNLICSNGTYYLYNAHGDVVQLTNTNGELTKNYNYDAFGNERSPAEDDANPFRYCGEYYDTETGLYYLRARYYDPLIGRFTQEDTHWNTANMIYGDNPQKINEREDKLGLKHYSYAPELLSILQAGNLYVYCVNNPIMYSDNTGYNSESVWWNPFTWGNTTKLVIGAIFITVGIVATVATGGAFLPALLAALKVVAISSATSAGIGFAIGGLTTGSWEGALDGLVDGAADGFMWGGIFSGSAQLLGSASKLLAGKNVDFSNPINWLFGNRNSQSTTLMRANSSGRQLFRIDADTTHLWHLHYGSTASAMRLHRTLPALFGYVGLTNILKTIFGGF